MTAYISVSFSNRSEADPALQAIRKTLQQHQIQSFVFVEKYRFAKTEEKAMMTQCMADIDKCDLLIAEVSDKAIGVGIEIGYARAKKKPVIYLRHISAEHSTTAVGISDHVIIYENETDLNNQLNTVLKSILYKPPF